MLAWLKYINDVLGQYPHIVSAIEALGTFAAVVVSLVIALWAQRANRTKLVASMFIANLSLDGVEFERQPQYIVVAITNKGIMPVRIPFSFLYWKMPFQWRSVCLVSPLDYFAGDPHIPQRSYPVEIQPRANVWFYVGTPDLQKKEMVEMWKKYPWRLYFFRRFIRFMVGTEDLEKFKVKMSKETLRTMMEKPLTGL